MDHKFTRTQFLPIPVKDAWVFFSNPRNLPRITPGTLGFKIVSNPPEKIYNGLIIEYRVKPLFGIPVKWVSEIKDVSAPYQFVDEQLEKRPVQVLGIICTNSRKSSAVQKWLIPSLTVCLLRSGFPGSTRLLLKNN